jgi:aspartyl-tRNA(Asn)/glutamyl-tRNA(Gln) amidotransferase subunit A
MQLIAVSDARDPMSLHYKPFKPMAASKACRILYIETFANAAVDQQISAGVAQVADRMTGLGHYVEHCANFTKVDPINEVVWPIIGQTGLAWLLQDYPGWENQISPSLVEMAKAGEKLSASQYLQALDLIAQVKRDLSILFDSYDVLMTPTAAALPWPANEAYPAQISGRTVGPRGHAIFTAFANAAGLPALNLPCSPAKTGLPIGFQLVGRQGADELLCCIGREYEKCYPWADRWPSLGAN